MGMSMAALASVALASSAGETMHKLISFPDLQSAFMMMAVFVPLDL